MNVAEQIERVFGIPVTFIKTYAEDEALCLVHKTWLRFLRDGRKIPAENLEKHTLDETFLSYFFTSDNSQQNSSWKLLTVHRWGKLDAKVIRFPKPHEEFLSVAVNLSYSQLINYITKANYKNLWEQAWRKYHTSDNPKRSKHKQDYNDALREIIKRLYKGQCVARDDGVTIFKKHPENVFAEKKGMIHPNLLDVLCAAEDNQSFLLIIDKTACSLWDCLMFSPSIFNGSTIRPLFVIYQLLQAIRCVHNQGLFMGPITLSDICVNENLWIQALSCSWKLKTHQLCLKNQDEFKNHLKGNECDTNKSSYTSEETTQPKNSLSQSKKEESQNNYINLSLLVQGWVDGNISNYDYLLELNKLAGRKMNNPHCHYVMPWIMDFSVPEGGWRDLTKSKFRLNKGDKQLDLIYESSIEAVNTNTSHNFSNIFQSAAVTVPHHTSEVLADITYYVYKARRMPKIFLCQHVRPKWVPAEYPSTIERLQEWTPDECIPEFFSDPEIFYSIHRDLSDLGVPWWCDSPEDFIKKHREALEGYHVSERLHHWIDLVFGYKLTGTSALKSKNICLPLVDDHTSVQNYGMVQLFAHPHPHKLSRSLFSRSLAPKTFRSVTVKVSEAKDSGDDDTSSESFGKTSFLKGLRSKTISTQDSSRWEPRPENQTIVLPKDFNPLAALVHFESLFSFLSWAGGERFDKTEDSQHYEVWDLLSYQVQDLFVLGCLLSEMAVFNHCKTLLQSVSLEERFSNCLKLLRMYKQEVPRSLQNGIHLLLQLPASSNEEAETLGSIPKNYPPVTKLGLPFPSPHQLLIPSIPIFPFPIYFPELYSFLYEINHFLKEISILFEQHDENSDFYSKIETIAEKKVCFAAEQLIKLLPMLNSEAIELIIPYIQEMFKNQHTSLLATWHLFGIIAQALGPQQTCKHFLKHLTKVFNTDRPSPKHLKLFHRSFLLQLIIGLGLHNFLMHFTTILIEAIGGCKDYSVQDPKSGDLYLQKSFSTDANKLSCMSEEMEDCLTDDATYDDTFLQSKALSQEGLNFQSEINNEEDNEIFDLDVNEEVLQETETKEVPTISVHQKENRKNDDEGEGDVNSSFAIPSVADDNNETDTSHLLNTEVWNTIPDSTYSQSAPASTSHLAEWSAFSEDVSDKSEQSEVRIKPRIDSEFDELTANYNQTEQRQEYNVSDVSAESMLWLAHRLGPVLTARYLTRNLLRMLTLCYDSSEKREIINLIPGNKESMLSISCKWFKGDLNAFKVLDCLSRIASLYGEQFIMLQYIKHIADLLNLCKKKIPASLESGLHGAMALLQHIIPYISDSVLMDYLQDVIIKDIILSILRLISSLRIVYPSGGKSRTMIALRMLDVIYTIGLRIGFEMTRKHLSLVLQKFFSCFNKIYNDRCEYKELDDILGSSGSSSSSPLKQQALEEMRQTFTPEVAFLTYIPFCKLTGGIHMEKMLKNDDLIRNLCLIHDKNMQLSASQHPLINGSKSTATHMTHHRDHSLGQDDSFVTGIFGKNVNVIGNRLDVHLGEESHLVMGTVEPVPATNLHSSIKLPDIPKYDISLIKRKMDNCHRHLKGNWLAYWEHETGRSEKDYHFDFKQIKLQTFVGHNGTVRTIQVLDNENSFLTSSKDKTVKLWSLRSCGDGSAQIPCQWTYTQHRKSVFAVSFLDSLRLVGSCDSTVHIWDPFLGSCIRQLEPSKGSPITVLTAMPAPSMTFLAATTNSTIKFLDARTCRYMHEFKVSVGTTGLIRCLAVSPNGNWLAVGHSTGMLSVLDIRTGFLIGTWLGHEGEILQLKPFNNSFFVSSSLDHGLTVWKYEDTQAKCHLKGPMEPVTSLCFYGNEIISGTTGNRVGLHSSIDKKASYTSTRLRSDTFKGMLTTMALLPLNRLLLLGTDNGNVVLLS